MKMYRLIRQAETSDGYGILGSLINEDGKVIALTYELTYKENKPFVSSIPTGVYKVGIHKSSSKGRCFKLYGVPSRSDILIHVGNTHLDTEGCILVGEKRTENAVLQSSCSLGYLLRTLPDTFKLVVMED